MCMNLFKSFGPFKVFGRKDFKVTVCLNEFHSRYFIMNTVMTPRSVSRYFILFFSFTISKIK